MQEEVENRTVAITTSAAKFTGRLFKAAICKYLEHRKNVKTKKVCLPKCRRVWKYCRLSR